MGRIPITEEVHGFLVLPEEAYAEFDEERGDNTERLFGWLSMGRTHFAKTEREAVEKARELYLEVGVKFYLVPIDVKLEVLETLFYQFQEKVIATVIRPGEDED